MPSLRYPGPRPVRAWPGLRRRFAAGGRGRLSRAACLVALLLTGNGCTTYQPTQSGYLSDYSTAPEGPDPPELWPRAALRTNSHNAASPVEVCQIDSLITSSRCSGSSPNPAGRGATPIVRQFLTSTLRNAVERASSGPSSRLSTSPGRTPRGSGRRSRTSSCSRPLLNRRGNGDAPHPRLHRADLQQEGYVEAEVIGPDGRPNLGHLVRSAGGIIDLFGHYTKSRGTRSESDAEVLAKELRETLEPGKSPSRVIRNPDQVESIPIPNPSR